MALVYLRELDEFRKFAIWKIDENEEELLSGLQLDTSEREKLAALKKGKRSLHWLATRVLLRYLLQTNEYIECPSDENGKPYLIDFDYRISLTHSYEYAAVMLSKKGECGIDLELVKDKVARIQHKFLKNDELDFIDPDNKIEQLYACWCAKEAVYKLQGKKGVSFREDMTILPFDYQEQGVLDLILKLPDGKQGFKVFYERFNNYMLGYVYEDVS